MTRVVLYRPLLTSERNICEMKTTGIVRKIDELGRIVIPKEMRRVTDIKNGDPVEIELEGDRIVLTKYAPTCIYCGKDSGITEFRGKKICFVCIDEIKREM